MKQEVGFLGEKNNTFTHLPHKESKFHIPLRKLFFILAISYNVYKERPTIKQEA